jgi:monoamine oxidase
MAHRLNRGTDTQTAPAGPRVTRRRVLQSALAGGAALALGSHTARAAVPARPPRQGDASPVIAVIGGGLAGLNAAYHLKMLGFNPTVYEARSRLGGRVHSVTGAIGPDLVIEMGGAFINSDHDDMLVLVEEFDLELFDRDAYAASVEAPREAYYGHGVRRTDAELAAGLQPLAAQIAEDLAALDEDWETVAPEFDALSVAEYLDLHADKIGEPWVRTLVETTIRTEYGVEPHESSALQLLYLVPTVEDDQAELLGSSDERYEVIGGNSRIVDALALALEGHIERNRELVRLTECAGRYRLTFKRGPALIADYVVLAIPFPVLRRMDLAVELPDGLRHMIQTVGPGRNEKVQAGFAERSWIRPDGFSLAVWVGEGFTEAWDATSRQPELAQAALTFYLGGDEIVAACLGGARGQGQRLVDQLDALLPGSGAAATGRFLQTRWTRSRLTQGGYTTFAPGQLTEFVDYFYIDAEDPAERQEVYAGHIVFAGEHLSDAYYGYMNGAAQTGRMAADVVARLIAEAQEGA